MTALAFLATIENPTRFRRPRDVGAYLGLRPKRSQSGERDVGGGISRQGDAMARHYLHEAANCPLTTWGGRSALKSWGLGPAKRIGAKKARVAVARKRACLLLRLWRDGAHYREDDMQTARATPTPLAGPSPSGDAGSNRRDECETVGCR